MFNVCTHVQSRLVANIARCAPASRVYLPREFVGRELSNFARRRFETHRAVTLRRQLSPTGMKQLVKDFSQSRRSLNDLLYRSD